MSLDKELVQSACSNIMQRLAQMGSKTANITEASLCASKLATNGSVSFSFHHEETGRHIVDSVVMGQAR